MKIIKVKDYDEMSDKACDMIVRQLKNLSNPVLGLATGSTPEGLYARLIEQYNQGKITFKDATTFNLDEYIGLAFSDPNSYHYFMDEKLFNHIDINHEQAHLPNGNAEDLAAECERYDALIEEAGGIDIQLLGLGTNGHIAFNEPGSSFEGRTAVVDLAQATLEANARHFESIEDMPTQALTMGIGAIMESEEIIMIASGESKADAVAQIIHGEVTEDFPASILQKHPNATLIADEAALSKV